VELRRAGLAHVVRIPLGVDLDCFHPDARRRAAGVRQRFGVHGAPLLVYVGRFAPEKQVELLLAAWPAIHARTRAHLLLVGDGPLREPLRRRHAGDTGAGSVHWVPYTTDRDGLAAWLAAADLFVSPGGAETFGLAALEALAAGTPVVSADRGGVAEQVAHSGAGALFREGDAGALAATVERLLRGDLDALRARARQHAEREHDWELTFSRLFALYEQVRA